MGKRRRRGARSGRDNDDDDTLSVVSEVSSISSLDSDFEVGCDESDALADALDQLTERTKTVRISGLKSLNKRLTRTPQTDFVGRCTETFSDNLCAIWKKSQLEETKMSCQLASLICVTLGDEGDRFYHAVRPALQAILERGKSAKRRAVVCRTIGFCCFASTNHTNDTSHAMELCQSLFDQSTDPLLLIAALEAWGLLFTTLSSTRQSMLVNEYVTKFLEFLSHSSIDVRCAAGENIALLYAAFYAYEGEDHYDDNDEEEPDLEYIIQVLEELATDASRSHSKKERASQKSRFRAYLATVQDGTEPSEILTISTFRHTFSGWIDTVRLSTFRRVLGTGLQQHFAENDLLSDVFQINVADRAALLASLDSKAVKRRDNWINKQNARDFDDFKKSERKKKSALRSMYLHD